MFSQLLTIAGIHLLALLSPGPDFVMISRNSLVYSRKTGVWSSVGLGLGILVHVTYSLVGIGVIISRSIVLFSMVKYVGAAYLLYIGYKSLRAQAANSNSLSHDRSVRDLKPLQAVRMGFLTNALNPKATLFFLALFTQVINPHTSIAVQALYGIEMSLMTMVYFSCVALLLSHARVQNRFARVQHILERVFGAVLIALGIKVALSSRH